MHNKYQQFSTVSIVLHKPSAATTYSIADTAIWKANAQRVIVKMTTLIEELIRSWQITRHTQITVRIPDDNVPNHQGNLKYTILRNILLKLTRQFSVQPTYYFNTWGMKNEYMSWTFDSKKDHRLYTYSIVSFTKYLHPRIEFFLKTYSHLHWLYQS
jgi:hypothetical protein